MNLYGSRMQQKTLVFSLSACLPCYRLVIVLDQNINVNPNQMSVFVIFLSLYFFPIIPSITMWCVQCSVYTYMQLQWHHIIKTYISLLECCAGVVKGILYSLSPNVGQNERQRGRGGKCEKKKSRTNNLPKESC